MPGHDCAIRNGEMGMEFSVTNLTFLSPGPTAPRNDNDTEEAVGCIMILIRLLLPNYYYFYYCLFSNQDWFFFLFLFFWFSFLNDYEAIIELGAKKWGVSLTHFILACHTPPSFKTRGKVN